VYNGKFNGLRYAHAWECATFCQKELNCMLNWIKAINHGGTFTR
jgi:hypothetical protein